MYSAIIFALIVVAVFLFGTGITRRSGFKITGGVLLFFFTIAFFSFLNFWAEVLWFENLGYNERFWKVILTKTGFGVLFALAGFVFIYFLTPSDVKPKKYVKFVSGLIGAFVALNWGVSNWDTILLYLNYPSTEVSDPILHKDVGFYLFALPFFSSITSLILTFAILSIITTLILLFVRTVQGNVELQRPITGIQTTRKYRWLYVNTTVIFLLLAAKQYLARFKLMYSTEGVVTGMGWTDANIRLPAYTFMIVIYIAVAILLLIPAFRTLIQKKLGRYVPAFELQHLLPLIVVSVLSLSLWIIAVGVIPELFQWLQVQPNEITYEKPYIANNIEFTRRGFKLYDIQEREFPVSREFNEQKVRENQHIFNNIRLWDWRALDSVYKQFQEIRLYYEFTDVDIDRYRVDGDYREVMVSAREMKLSNLPEKSQTFVNKRFKYTHGYGITMTTVSEFTPSGLPNLLIKDIPPKSTYPSLDVKRPQIYYGELANSHVIVNSEEKEFEYPSGEKNIYAHYSGTGGVKLRNIWRKFLYGWVFDGTRFFLSGYPTPESRLMFDRNISRRINKIAPFLHFDNDPYIVLADGKLFWIVDAYTVSGNYPYSEWLSSWDMLGYSDVYGAGSSVSPNLNNINYIRNSVKVVIDAYNGSVDFYVFDEQDPVIKTWWAIFPDMFKDKKQMPGELLKHIRYPADFLLVQGLMYAKYHMKNPAVFYNQEDLWVRATEKYYNQIQPVSPYYIVWEPPDSEQAEFVLILPFTPKNKQVLIGWIAGMCDPDNYGRFLAYKFPKELRVLGTQQMETKIDQDRYLSQKLSLWDQRGSQVIRGNVLVIPVDDTLIYVEPIYLQAERAAYPELRVVAIMHNDKLSYGETFDEALRGLFAGQKQKPEPEIPRKKATFEQLVRQANDAFENYLDALGDKQFDRASGHLQSLEQALQQLTHQMKEEKEE